ncbi:universal stress protein [Paraburkholderia sp. LEh10]|uniref:universal stress protein n=1 Tax=Paraburkholderia sp. LEh10 TaxID=2821353 RepID=UPI001AE18272|nr:universal stress protein [Paraburkholderia sp. LEh10]MBP0592589.1 universal stress protein [Paraburkholderia sp. LEh10]
MVKHILVAVGANRNDAVLATAIDKARRTGARLTAVYIVDTMPWWAMTSVEYGCIDTLQLVHELERTVERRCLETFELDAWDIHTRAITVPLEGNSVGRAIAKLADELDADLIVVGAGRGSKWRFWEERMSDVVGRCTRRSVLIAMPAKPAAGAPASDAAASQADRAAAPCRPRASVRTHAV